MEREELVQLTNEVYRLTLLFPQKEPLRYKIRACADEILADCLNNTFPPSLKVIRSFLEVAEKQKWVKPEWLLSCTQKYASLERELPAAAVAEGLTAEEGQVQKPLDFSNPGSGVKNNDRRHERILEILREKGRSQVWELKKVFPGVSKRTLRRDFESLLAQGRVERIGDKNQTFYTLKPAAIVV